MKTQRKKVKVSHLTGEAKTKEGFEGWSCDETANAFFNALNAIAEINARFEKVPQSDSNHVTKKQKVAGNEQELVHEETQGNDKINVITEEITVPYICFTKLIANDNEKLKNFEKISGSKISHGKDIKDTQHTKIFITGPVSCNREAKKAIGSLANWKILVNPVSEEIKQNIRYDSSIINLLLAQNYFERITTESNAFVSVSPYSTSEIVIVGQKSFVEIAENLLGERVKNLEQEDQFEDSFKIKKARSGRLIGPNGSVSRALTQLTGANVRVDFDGQKVFMSGTKKSVDEAKLAVKNILGSDDDPMKILEQLYPGKQQQQQQQQPPLPPSPPPLLSPYQNNLFPIPLPPPPPPPPPPSSVSTTTTTLPFP